MRKNEFLIISKLHFSSTHITFAFPPISAFTAISTNSMFSRVRFLHQSPQFLRELCAIVGLALTISPAGAQIVANETLIFHAYDNATPGSYSSSQEQLILSGYNALNNSVYSHSTIGAYETGFRRDFKGLAYNQDNGAFYSIFNNASPPGSATAQEIRNFSSGSLLATFSGTLGGVAMGDPGGYELINNWVGLNYHDGNWYGLYNDKSGAAFGMANEQVVVRLDITNPGASGTVTSYTKMFNLSGSLADGYTNDFLDIDYYQGSWYGLYNDNGNNFQPEGGWVAYPSSPRQVILNLGTGGTSATYASNIGFLDDPVINDDRYNVGTVRNFENDSHGFSMVYSPVPEPSGAALLLALGVVCVFSRSRRQFIRR